MNKAFLASESFKKGFVLSSFLNFFAKIIAFFNVTIIAYFFGTSSATDVYFFCVSLLGTISSFLIALNGTILIPEAMRIREQVSERESQLFLSFFFFLYVAICIPVSLTMIANPAGVFSLVSKFDLKTLHAHADIICCSIPLLILLTANSFWAEVLVSYKFFSMSVVASLLNSVLSILFVFFLHHRLNVVSILIGALCANVAQLAFSIVLLRKVLHWSFRCFPISIRKKTLKDILVAQAGNVSTLLMGYVPLMLISRFPSGILSSINYATKIPDVAGMLITTQFSAVTGIKFNELYAQKKEPDIGRTFRDASAFVQFTLIPICIWCVLYSRDFISILFGHGAFDNASVENASRFMQLYVLVLPFLAHNTMVARLFMAAQKVDKSYIYQIIMGGVMVIIVYAAVTWLGPIGYPLGLLSFFVTNSVAATVIMRRNFRFIPYERTLWYTLQCLAFNSPLIALALVVDMSHFRHSIWFLGTVIALYSLLLLALNQAFRFNGTIADHIGIVLARIRRKRKNGQERAN